METLPVEIISYIISFSRVSLVHLTCKKLRDLYKKLHGEFRYFPRSILLNMSTTIWYVEKNKDKFNFSDIRRAVSLDSLRSFKYMIKKLEIKLTRKTVKTILLESAKAPGIKILRYILEKLCFDIELRNDIDGIISIIDKAVLFHNLELIEYLHSKEYNLDKLEPCVAFYGVVEIFEWMYTNKIYMDKERLIREFKITIEYNERKLCKLDTKNDSHLITKLEKEIFDFVVCISYLESI